MSVKTDRFKTRTRYAKTDKHNYKPLADERHFRDYANINLGRTRVRKQHTRLSRLILDIHVIMSSPERELIEGEGVVARDGRRAF